MRVRICDLRTGRRILDLPYLKADWTGEFNGAETVTATVSVNDRRIQNSTSTTPPYPVAPRSSSKTKESPTAAPSGPAITTATPAPSNSQAKASGRTSTTAPSCH